VFGDSARTIDAGGITRTPNTENRKPERRFLPARTLDQGILMKRFALLFGALVLATYVTGCDSGGGSSPTKPADSTAGATVAHPQAKGEVAEYEAKEAKRVADRAAKTPAGKAVKPGSGTP
jgi:hypothetical protein